MSRWAAIDVRHLDTRSGFSNAGTMQEMSGERAVNRHGQPLQPPRYVHAKIDA